jgi:uncharacterized protein YjbI with pentapeptide repeats
MNILLKLVLVLLSIWTGAGIVVFILQPYVPGRTQGLWIAIAFGPVLLFSDVRDRGWKRMWKGSYLYRGFSLKRVFRLKPAKSKPERAVQFTPAAVQKTPEPPREPEEPGVIKIRACSGSKNVVVRIPGDSLVGVDLSDKDLSNADFSGRDLTNALLRNCILGNAEFKNASLIKADLSGSKTNPPGACDVRRAYFLGANLEDANLSGTMFDYCDFDEANLARTNFRGASLQIASFRDAVLRDTDFSGADLEGSVIPRLKYPMRLCYDSYTKWPKRFSPTDIGQAFRGNCPKCGERCRLERPSFSENIWIYRCSRRHFTAVQCAQCEKDVMVWVEDLDYSVHAECASCRWTSTGIPKEWWSKNVQT